MNEPLAERMRPGKLAEFTGQTHLVGQGKPLARFFEQSFLPSMILWGPPGVGKTTLARLLANRAEMSFYSLSAIHAGVKDIREAIERSENHNLFSKQKSVLFIDEIHRFSKSQQDSLLGAVEKGIIILIGATTENPSFEVIPALLSRCQVFVLEHLKKEELICLIDRAVSEDFYLKEKRVVVKEYDFLIRLSGGDARKALNALEVVVSSFSGDEVVVTDEFCRKSFERNMSLYDKSGEMHYDIISAFIKSIRGSDPNAAIYWLARMVDGGEDPLFIARRLVILASEDIGNANPTALVLANNCFSACNSVGYPEARIILSQCASYLACSQKSNAAYMAIENALEMVRKQPNLPVPLALRNAPTELMEQLGYGNQYAYAHNYENNFVAQEYLPDEIKGTVFYNPAKNAREDEQRLWLRRLWKEKYGY